MRNCMDKEKGEPDFTIFKHHKEMIIIFTCIDI